VIVQACAGVWITDEETDAGVLVILPRFGTATFWPCGPIW
jgi:hypothetical protein